MLLVELLNYSVDFFVVFHHCKEEAGFVDDLLLLQDLNDEVFLW